MKTQAKLLMTLTSFVVLSGFEGPCGLIDPPEILPTPLCSNLSEDACIAEGACRADYHGGEYIDCVDNSPCHGLDEATCVADSFCEAEYATEDCVTCLGTGCPPCDVVDPTFVGCREPTPECSGVVCALYCPFGYAGDENGCPTCECLPPPPQVVCQDLDEAACQAHDQCQAEYVMDGCIPCPEGQVCTTECRPNMVFDQCTPVETGCQSDADCPGGYCEIGVTCTAIGCPDPVNYCVSSRCDDGSPLICTAAAPSCAPGQVAAARDGCWACLDARTCD